MSSYQRKPVFVVLHGHLDGEEILVDSTRLLRARRVTNGDEAFTNIYSEDFNFVVQETPKELSAILGTALLL